MKDEVATTFDELILRGQTIRGIKLIKDTFGCSLQEALIFYHDRYRHLRETRPEDFAQSHEEYWKGFYS
ncbi:hypothetical protein [Planotetraspora kaengkrachanensis]|uniref:Uncharacterized protein n=1 Tax=Planotetraspora kaengkrachanensis TaxID=575193 RepID=A0A8J3PTE8_9ACTN|nr:hypothetical protein [Planotetraspora kaengkrachanensis]GIG80358.1 hypothetical protein Pka01_34850 [Planotetraspora kaengkrachanensis]